MTRRTLSASLAALGATACLTAFAAQAAALPPTPPPGVSLSPPVAQSALDHTATACYAIDANNPVASGRTPNPPLVGTAAFLSRGQTFCPFIDG